MKLIYHILRPLWKALFAVNFAAGLIILYPLFYLFLTRESWFRYAFVVKRFWARWILFTPGIILRVKSDKKLRALPQPAIYCANHSSYLDIVASYAAIPNYFVFMAKQELGKAPLFNIFFKKMNILVDRKSKTMAHKAFLRSVEEIDKGHSMFLFPEGTISKKAPGLISFKNGAFKLAIEKQVPIVPVTFINNWERLQNGGFFKSNGSAGCSDMIIHSPVDTNGLTEDDVEMLKDKIFSIIQEPLLVRYPELRKQN